MILLIQDRKNNYHLADYVYYTSKYTVCGLIYSKKDIVNTFMLDAPVSCFCTECYTQLSNDEVYMNNKHLRFSNGKLLHHLRSKYQSIQGKAADTRHKYNNLNCKFWRKLTYYKLLSEK